MPKRTSILAIGFAVLVLSGVFCSFCPASPEKSALADTPVATELPDKLTPLERGAVLRKWLMFVGVLGLLFLFSLILFRSLGRRLGKRSFRAHDPTPHADIWSSHKPPEFFDP